MATQNEYWIYLEKLRRSGVVNMYGASPYLERAFGISEKEARKILVEWMENYKSSDYDF